MLRSNNQHKDTMGDPREPYFMAKHDHVMALD